MRRLGETALGRIFARLHARGRGDHDIRDAGAAGDPTGATRRGSSATSSRSTSYGRSATPSCATAPGAPVQIDVDDFEVVETERRSGAAVALLIDLSYSMALRGTWAAAKSTALALHTLVIDASTRRTRSR